LLATAEAIVLPSIPDPEGSGELNTSATDVCVGLRLGICDVPCFPCFPGIGDSPDIEDMDGIAGIGGGGDGGIDVLPKPVFEPDAEGVVGVDP
jgi:hypothetical protein